MFVLRVLGSLSLQREGGPVPGAALQKRRVGLLALLAAGGDQGLARDRLQAWLWPESDSTRARHALDQLVYATRRALEVDPFMAEGRDLRLDPSVITSDISAFERGIRLKRWEDAVAAYGGALLEGVHLADSRELESWIDASRARLAQQYHAALEQLAGDSSAAEDRAAAIQWRRRLAASDPLSSRAALGLIREIAASGDNAGAIQHARAYQRLVRAELEVEPDPQIEIMVASISRQPGNRHPLGVSDQQGSTADSPPPREMSAGRYGPAANERHETLNRIAPGTERGKWRVSLPILSAVFITVAVIIASVIGTSVIPREGVAPIQEAAGRRSGSLNREAHEAYLRGVNAWNDRSSRSLDTAVVHFRTAIEMEPIYPQAYAGLANAYVMLGYSGYRPGNAMFPKAKGAAQRAIQLDSTVSEAYAALGMELTWERNFSAAEVAFQKAISLDPDYATAHQWYGILHFISGRAAEAVIETRRAAELDPLSLQIQNNYATFLSNSGERAAALSHYQKVVGEEPDSAWVRRNPWLLTNMAGVYAANGRHSEALRFAEQAVKVLPGHPRALSALAGVYRSMGKREQSRQVFARSDTTNDHYEAYRGLFYAAEGDADSAFASFDRVEDWGIPVLISLRNLPKIKGDLRYGALLTRLGMTVRTSETRTSR